MAVMLYKYPGPHDIHGGKFDYNIVDDDAVDAAVNDGWSKTTQEAYNASKPKTPKTPKTPKKE